MKDAYDDALKIFTELMSLKFTFLLEAEMKWKEMHAKAADYCGNHDTVETETTPKH